jgi:signal peptidase II
MAADAALLPAARRAPTRPALLAYAVAALALALDQLSKWWVLERLRLPAVGLVPVLPPVFNLTLVRNPGVSFGLFNLGPAVGPWVLTLFALGVAAGLAWWVRDAARALTGLAIGLMVGGALGNAVDRVRLGEVTDFLDVRGLHFPWVFNGADAAVTVGVALIVLDSLRPAPSTAAADAAAPKTP